MNYPLFDPARLDRFDCRACGLTGPPSISYWHPMAGPELLGLSCGRCGYSESMGILAENPSVRHPEHMAALSRQVDTKGFLT